MEALVFMLVGLQGHWKTPSSYSLCNTISASTLSALMKEALNLAASHSLRVHSIIMDGTATDFDSMRNLGCEVGTKLEYLKSCFAFDLYNHSVFSIPYPCHMLKLAINAIADVGDFVDDNGEQLNGHI